jgi:hypothetical protein
VGRDGGADRPAAGPPEEAVDRLAGLLPGQEPEDALEGLEPEEIIGLDGLVAQLAGRLIETALGAELNEPLGYPPGEAPPGGVGNVRNGSTQKTVWTELGPGDVKTPHDRKGTFDPKLLGKRQTRLAGLDNTGIKALKAMAAGRPLIGTSLGLEGMRFEDARHEVVADAPAKLAEATVRLLEDLAAGRGMGAEARRHVEPYRWAYATAPGRQLYAKLTDAH